MHREEEAFERRIVTVLFADLVGFTPLSEQLDAEDVAAIQDRYFALARETINRYGGRIEKFIGDAVMSVFGAARSRDDDVERAVRAGLALVSGVQQLNASLGLDEDTLQLRVGVNTGEAVVAASGPDEGRVTGDTVNTAARFQAAAPPGEVLVGEPTALAVAAVADLGEPLRLELKGKAEPVVARVVGGLRSEPSREQAMGGLRAPTVGRERDMAELERGLERAAVGSVERWLIVAPPGVGKSRLLREFGDTAASREKVVVWRARARPNAVSPFDAIAGLISAALEAGSREEADDRLTSKLAAAAVPAARTDVVADAVLSLVWPREAEAGGRRPSDDRDTLFASWVDALDALSDGRTQVWLIEDIHWAGGDVLAFFEAAASRTPEHGRLIVATARPSLLEVHPDWGADDADAARQVLRLATLEATDARELVTALVGDALPAPLVERIVERSDGNCLFIEELLRTWVSVGTLVANDGGQGWRLAFSAEDIPLPQSVQQIYAAQLDDLPPDARRVARRASVAGRRFPVHALEPLDAAKDGIEPLRRRELVTGPLSEPIFGDAFSYRHALLRDAGYASLARAERARLHARLARWLDQAAGERSAEVAEQIAGHYAAALESAPALARAIDDGLDREQARALAASWYERAGDAALALSAHDAARQLLRRSIDLTSDADLLAQARRWERLGDATAYADDMDEGAADFSKALDLYRASLAERRSPEAISGLARTTASFVDVWYQQLRFAEARDLAHQTLSELPDADPASQARLLVARAQASLGASGPSGAAQQDLERGVELARSVGDRNVELTALSTLTTLHHEGGRGSEHEWSVIAAMAAELGDWEEAVAARINGAMTSLDDHAKDTHGGIYEAREIAVAHGRIEDTGWCDYVEAEAAFIYGDWDRALAAASRAMDLGERNAYRRLTVRCVHVCVPIATARRDRAPLERAAAFYKSLEGKFEFPDSPYSRIIRAAQDLDLAAAGLAPYHLPDPEPRIVAFETEIGGGSWSAAVDRIFREWLDTGHIEGARKALETLAAAMPTFTHLSALGHGMYLLLTARLALTEGDRVAASDTARNALARFRESDAPWWKAKAIRLLERTGAADPALVGEVEQIERALGSVRPTP